MNGNVIVARPFAKWFLVVIGLALLVPNAGCRLCCNSEDLAYPAYGGAWQRTRREDGRVGSLFDPAGARIAELTSRDESKSVDELYRNRLTDEPSDADDRAEDKKDSEDTKGPKTESGKDLETDLKRRSDALKNLELEDIDLVPGEAMPPDFN